MRIQADVDLPRQRAAHRRALMAKLPDGLIVLAGGIEVIRNNDVSYVFRQGSDFLYLTGVPEPGYLLLLDPKRARSVLFIPRVDAHYRVWLGHVPGPAEAAKRFGIREVRYADELPAVARAARKGSSACYAEPQALARCRAELGRLRNRPGRLKDALADLRACKTPGEVELLQRANDVSARGHLAAMRAARPGMSEYQVQAEFERVCVASGLKHLGYPSIVAAGRNAAVLHYHHNDARLRRGELLLIDAGGECEGYSADITRTFPLGKRFSRRQRDVYAIVLETQKECIRRARPGMLSGDLHVHSMRLIAEGLKSLKLLRGPVDDLVTGGAVRLFYPHGLTHTLGLDVHDTLGGRRRKVPPRPHVRVRFNAYLEPGFVITMEPGIYFIDALLRDKELRRKYREHVDFGRADSFLDFGGIRIEDDIVVSSSGAPRNLTTVPKEIAAVEAACGL
ncbi:MAG: aminopeptidase P family protein [Elusimicrobia bacterium]|nr:aminopeptidase P family protein [Elusimicrobiota bacterium]